MATIQIPAIQIIDASKDDQDVIETQLVRYNNSAVPFKQDTPFVPVNRCIKQGDEVVGGIMALVYCWKVLAIDILWVKDTHRNKGYATVLMDDVENIAREMGCKLAHLDTFDFQAKELYEKRGYSVFGTLEDCPEGHNRYYMAKKLQG